MNSFLTKIKVFRRKSEFIVDNNYIVSIKNGFLYSTPLIIVSSFFLLFINFPIENWNEIVGSIFGNEWRTYAVAPVNAITNIISIISVTSISYSLAEKKAPEYSFSVSITELVAFLIITPFSINITSSGSEKISGLSLKWLGADGIFLSIIVALFVTNIYSWIIKKKYTISLSENIPIEVANSFTALCNWFFF